MPKLKGLKIIAGHSGLGRKVSSVTVMEVPDILQWLKGNDFLITSLYSVRDSVESQCNLIESLAKASCSCIAVKTGQYVKQIEQPLCDMANRYGLPIVIIPYRFTYIEMITTIASYILEENNMDAVVGKFVRDIVFDTYDDAQLMAERGRILGIHLQEHAFAVLSVSLPAKLQPNAPEANEMEPVISDLARALCAHPGILYSPKIVTDETLSLLLEAESIERIEELLPAIKKEARRILNAHAASDYLRIGIGTAGTGMEGIKNSFFHALRTIRAGQIFRPDETVLEYREMELYCLFNNAIYNNTRSLTQSILGKIDNKEILDTLIAYYECNANLNKTAERLFAHRNTIKYRLSRVKEITGLDVQNIDQNFHLYLAVLAKKIQDSGMKV